jgi:four helix bundle protein
MRFLDTAWGSGAELETQLLLATALGYLDKNSARPLLDLYAEIDRMLGALQRTLEKRSRKPSRP